jgi:hypothetical protein
VGYGDSGWVPYTFFLRKGQTVDVGTLKLFLSREQVYLSHVAQPSPFQVVPVKGHSTVPSSSSSFVSNGGGSATPSSSSPLPLDSSRGTVQTVVRASEGSEPSSSSVRLPWDTVEIRVVQRLANK